MSQNNELQAAAQAVLDRWNSPNWEWHKHGHTADLMDALYKALAAQAGQIGPVSYLANGTRFKASKFPYGVCINGLPKELAGRWVALVAADDDCHMKAHPAPVRQPLTIQEVEQILAQHNYELHGDRARYIVRMTGEAHGITAQGGRT